MTSLFNMILNVVGDLYGEFVNQVIRGASGGPVKKILDITLSNAIKTANDKSNTKQCTAANFKTRIELPSETYHGETNNLVNLTKNIFVKAIDYALNDLMQPHSPIYFDINDVMDILSSVYNNDLPLGSLLVLEEVLSFTSTSLDNSDAKGADINIQNLTLNGLNTIHSFKFLHPVSAYEAENKISIGNLTDPVSGSVMVKLNTKYNNDVNILHKNVYPILLPCILPCSLSYLPSYLS